MFCIHRRLRFDKLNLMSPSLLACSISNCTTFLKIHFLNYVSCFNLRLCLLERVVMGENKEDQVVTEVSFSGLLLGFSSAALHYLGHTAISGKNQASVNLPLAKQNIDIIVMLELKTRGNLNDDEQKLMSQVLVDLRDKYQHEASKSS